MFLVGKTKQLVSLKTLRTFTHWPIQGKKHSEFCISLSVHSLLLLTPQCAAFKQTWFFVHSQKRRIPWAELCWSVCSFLNVHRDKSTRSNQSWKSKLSVIFFPLGKLPSLLYFLIFLNIKLMVSWPTLWSNYLNCAMLTQESPATCWMHLVYWQLLIISLAAYSFG